MLVLGVLIVTAALALCLIGLGSGDNRYGVAGLGLIILLSVLAALHMMGR